MADYYFGAFALFVILGKFFAFPIRLYLGMSVTHEKPMLKAFDAKTAARALQLARETLQIEPDAITALHARLETDASVGEAIALLLNCKGRVVVSGIGKSGHIARKIAATLASTGTPALFVHPAEAAHGDLGMVTPDDAFIAISYSGESAELMAILPVVKRMGSTLISMTGKPNSSLAKLADVHLDVSVAKEACTLNLAPTASTTVTLALGDAIAVALLDLRGFKEEDFARSHPGGALGRRLLTHVHDVMRSGERVPKVAVEASLLQALEEMTKKGMGMTAIVDGDNRPVGVFTDGDLRRMIEKVQDFSKVVIRDVMHANPRAISPEKLAVDDDGKLVGALHIHDLTRAKVI